MVTFGTEKMKYGERRTYLAATRPRVINYPKRRDK
jgi:hypothetical protein